MQQFYEEGYQEQAAEVVEPTATQQSVQQPVMQPSFRWPRNRFLIALGSLLVLLVLSVFISVYFLSFVGAAASSYTLTPVLSPLLYLVVFGAVIGVFGWLGFYAERRQDAEYQSAIQMRDGKVIEPPRSEPSFLQRLAILILMFLMTLLTVMNGALFMSELVLAQRMITVGSAILVIACLVELFLGAIWVTYQFLRRRSS
ncbi:hypothetical protein EI42_03522 [Thermosporothrix hazakensis]|jgi:hypothetical protein|uniref:Uncharacterized protein n=1 Tax=Thermosporothrix hazakensis TaxID=644383 RepID=A0A326UDF9_THEHA|nr:hypothetical protein [Thermosporothrix hazakensis]PZW27436.1 hypothetical protein EI42_03522 [Thermosporothrix hazakensis]GCE45603.1 hypothetical protein KTH_04720 [Thermosporothrix hazakensis]